MDRATDIFNKIVENGVKAIDDFIDNADSEELFLDFKQSSDKGENLKLSKNDLSNFGEAISGFGNSQGGVIVWGVRCTKKEDGSDVAHGKMPIVNPTRFRSWLEGCVSGRTLPPHPMVRSHSIDVGNSFGYVISLIPKSNYAPHQEIKTLNYYMRAGSSFVKVPHDILSGMFGRRPQPKIVHVFDCVPAKLEKGKIVVESRVTLRNEGMGTARDIFFNAYIMDSLGKSSDITVFPRNEKYWFSRFEYDMIFSAITHDGVKLATTSYLPAFSFKVYLEPPFEKDFKIIANCGSDGCQTIHFEMKCSKEVITEAYEALFEKMKKGIASEKDMRAFSTTVLGIDKEGAVSADPIISVF